MEAFLTIFAFRGPSRVHRSPASSLALLNSNVKTTNRMDHIEFYLLSEDSVLALHDLHIVLMGQNGHAIIILIGKQQASAIQLSLIAY